jgi:tetratricopeptide (TPR) repeat protein
MSNQIDRDSFVKFRFLSPYFFILTIFAVNLNLGVLFAQEAAGVNRNAGVISSSNAPEFKKGTVLLKEGSGSSMQNPVAMFPKDSADDFTSIQKEARTYYLEGVNCQSKGDLDTALNLYQKAIILDPFLDVAYNDLGILYEANLDPDRAEGAYLKALEINPRLMGAYSNLASLYESRRDLQKAAYYWQKRADMGMVLAVNPESYKLQKETLSMAASVNQDKAQQRARKEMLKKDDKAQAMDYLEKARALYYKGDEVAALKTAIDAQLLDSGNDEIQEFVDLVQNRVLTR